MSAVIIDGRAVAARIREAVTADIEAMRAEGSTAPGLAVVLFGDDQASAIYVRNKGRAAEQVGMRFQLHTPARGSTTEELVTVVQQLNESAEVDGMLVQLPLPEQIDPDAVGDAIAPDKDADGFHPLNFGRLAAGRPAPVAPGTPSGCM